MPRLINLELSEYLDKKNKLLELAKSCYNLPHESWLSVRDAAKNLKLIQDDIIDLVDEVENLDLIVGIRTPVGIGTHDNKGDYRIEYYE